jgi:hypothetical protein
MLSASLAKLKRLSSAHSLIDNNNRSWEHRLKLESDQNAKTPQELGKENLCIAPISVAEFGNAYARNVPHASLTVDCKL